MDKGEHKQILQERLAREREYLTRLRAQTRVALARVAELERQLAEQDPEPDTKPHKLPER